MARFKLFPRFPRPSLGELLGISQAERQIVAITRMMMILDVLVVTLIGASFIMVDVRQMVEALERGHLRRRHRLPA